MAGPYFSLSQLWIHLLYCCVPVVSPQVWEGDMCKDNTLGIVSETLLLYVEHKHHLFVKEYLEKRRTGEMENTEREKDMVKIN